MNRIARQSLSALITVTLLAGCSASSTASTASASADSSAKGTLKVGMECNYAPFNWSTTEAGEYTKPISSVDYCDGYDVVMATKIADGMGMDVQIVKTSWENLIPALNNGEIDAIIAGMTDTKEREESVNFTKPYYTSQEVVIVKSDSDLTKITDIQQLSGYKVMGQLNTLYDDIINQITGVIHATPLEDYPSMVNALNHGEVDALTAELPVAEGVVAANSGLSIVTFADGHGFQADASVSVAVAKSNTDLQQKIQTVLDTISESDRQQIMLDAVKRQPATNE